MGAAVSASPSPSLPEDGAEAKESAVKGAAARVRGLWQQRSGALKEAEAPARTAENDLLFWRRCAQELLRDQEGASEAVLVLERQSEQLVAETRASRLSCADLTARLAEVEKIAEAAREQRDEVRAHNAELEADVARAAADADEARAQAAAESKAQQALSKEVEALSQPVEPGGSACGGDVDEDDQVFFTRRVEERQREINVLTQERTRLEEALHRHSGHQVMITMADRAEAAKRSRLTTVDRTIASAVTLLFKSSLARRLFAAHLVLLYSWLFFLLFMLTVEMPQPHHNHHHPHHHHHHSHVGVAG
eukprot:NODE_1353_length_1167_cov_320.439748.p1 GENE.NODE_1353_length_1167_cov_320.439748~~NODE_1353_length_1167_cov_320.439748.p1  ORF type:complete len:307 (+),score=120.94 NODE_1353_length_1167_cov_320.439748:3-923(+)